MKSKLTRLRPAGGFSQGLHLLLTVFLPVLVYIFVRINLAQLAIAVILLSKWRMFAVRPRHWLAYIRANAADITVGISTVIFMTQTSSQIWQLIWAAVYAIWLLLIKPGTTLLSVSAQAFIAQLFGLMALYAAWGGSPLIVLVLGTWAVCFVGARHFFSAFDEAHARFLADVWAFFGACIAWVLGHWLLFYGVVSQPTLLLTVIGFSLGTLYYLQKVDKLTVLVRRQLLFIMSAVIVVVLVFSDWSSKVL